MCFFDLIFINSILDEWEETTLDLKVTCKAAESIRLTHWSIDEALGWWTGSVCVSTCARVCWAPNHPSPLSAQLHLLLCSSSSLFPCIPPPPNLEFQGCLNRALPLLPQTTSDLLAHSEQGMQKWWPNPGILYTSEMWTLWKPRLQRYKHKTQGQIKMIF